MEYGSLRLVFFTLGFTVFTLMGFFVPRRPQQNSFSSRFFHNFAFGAFNPMLLKLLLSFGLLEWTMRVQGWGAGVLNQVEWPYWLEVVLVVVVFDGLIYWQHRLTHILPPLWRFHRVHHSDTGFDASTAIRFHFIEIICSFGIKMLAIWAFGGPVLGVFLFEVILNFSAMFNHSNWFLPKGLDALLRKIIVTPDFDRFHHSVHRDETDSNFSFFLSIWDYCFRTYKAQPREGHENMQIGIGLFAEEKEQNFIKMWTQPFRKAEPTTIETNH